MDVPIGALGDGFEDRLVLESRSELAIWGGCLLYLLLVPFFLLMFSMSFGLLQYVLAVRPGWLNLVLLTPVFLAEAARGLYNEYRARDFQEVSLQGSALEVSCGGEPSVLEVAELVDTKVWPYALHLGGADGWCLHVHGMAGETKLEVLERLLDIRATAHVNLLRTGQEIPLARSWAALWEPATRGLYFALFAYALGRQAHAGLGIGLGLLTLALTLGPALRYFFEGGMIVSQTGLRKLGQTREQEVPWSEVDECRADAYFQDTLVVTTRRGDFRLLSQFNPAVWALVIRELQQA